MISSTFYFQNSRVNAEFFGVWFFEFLVFAFFGFCAHALAQIVLASFAKARCGEPQHFTACHFEPFQKGDNDLQSVGVTKNSNIVILSNSEKSKEFKIRFEFVDTSLRSV